MTIREALEKIRPLPKLKSGYSYYIGPNGRISIKSNEGMRCLYLDFEDFVNGIYCSRIENYTEYFEKEPVYQEIWNGTRTIKKLVGYK